MCKQEPSRIRGPYRALTVATLACHTTEKKHGMIRAENVNRGTEQNCKGLSAHF